MRSEVSLLTLCGPLRKVRSVNETSNGYRSLIPTATEPGVLPEIGGGGGVDIVDAGTATGKSVINIIRGPGVPGANGLFLMPYGLHASVDNKTMSMRVVAWKPVGFETPSTMLWIPIPLVEVACTLSGTQIGVANKTLIATEGFADTIALTGTTANANVGVELVSPANDTAGHMIVDIKGAQKIEVIFTTGGSATSCNALFALL